MAHVDGVGLARRDGAKLTTLALGNSLHRILHEKGWSRPIEDIRAGQPGPAPLGLSIARNERREQRAGGGSRGARACHDLLFGLSETADNDRGGSEMFEKAIADL